MPHGSRRSYVLGCRCVVCRSANAAYAAQQRAAPVGHADVARVLAHVAALRSLGLGYRHIARLAGVAASVVKLLGPDAKLRPATAAKLLAVVQPSLAHGCVVPGTKTWRFVDSLEREGFTRRELAFRLGRQSQQLQLHRRVRVRSALLVATLHSHLA
jgi:hypothetical protein